MKIYVDKGYVVIDYNTGNLDQDQKSRETIIDIVANFNLAIHTFAYHDKNGNLKDMLILGQQHLLPNGFKLFYPIVYRKINDVIWKLYYRLPYLFTFKDDLFDQTKTNYMIINKIQYPQEKKWLRSKGYKVTVDRENPFKDWNQVKINLID